MHTYPSIAHNILFEAITFASTTSIPNTLVPILSVDLPCFVSLLCHPATVKFPGNEKPIKSISTK